MITSNAKILCVDDDPDLLNINASFLRSAGYEVLEASTGKECLTLARKEHPDLILLDVVLPDIDGFDVCKKIKSDRELVGVYIILISGKEISSETQAKVLDAGADGYIVRPVSGRELLARVQTMLRLKQTEIVLRKSEERLHFLLKATPAVIYTCKASPPYGATFVSENIKTRMGYKPEEFTENPKFWAEHIHPEDAQRVFSEILHLFENDYHIYEYRFLYKDGNYRWMHDEFNLIRDVDGKPIEIAGFWFDINDYKEAVEALRSSEEKYKTMIANMYDVVFQLTPLGIIQYVSPKVEEIYGYKPEDLIGNDLRVTTPNSTIPKALELLRRTLSEEEIRNIELPQLDSKGNIISMELNCSPIRKDGKIIGVLGVMRDMTGRKKTEEALREATLVAEAANRAKSDFLANMSHELTTPLNSIIGFSQILQDELYGDLNEKQKEYVSDILRSGIHLLGLLYDMLDISKLDTGTGELKINRFLVKDLLTTMIISFKEKSLEKNISLSFEIAPEAEIEIEADLGMMKQIMFNLLDNALKYTPDGGSVSVQARLVNSEQYLVNNKKLFTDDYSLTTDRDLIEISVVDTGIGIKQENIPTLFHVFTQLETPYIKEYAGVGIGLVLTKKLVELHGGRIWAESEYGKGSRFTFVIPVRTIDQRPQT